MGYKRSHKLLKMEESLDYIRTNGINDSIKVHIIVPNYNEDPWAVGRTITQILYASSYSSDISEDKPIIYSLIFSDQTTNRRKRDIYYGKICTAKDVVLIDYGMQNLPSIFHLEFNEMLEDVLYDYLRGYDKLKPIIEDEKEPRGKGWNMLISSLTVEDENSVMVFFDAENEVISQKQIVSLIAPLAYNGSNIKFTKAAFDRYHMENGRRVLGGRVNWTLGVPLFETLSEKEISSDFYYPFSGEIGIHKTIWDDVMLSLRYGVETSVLLSLTGKNGLLDEDEFVEVYLEINMDQPLGEGKPKNEICEGIKNMSKQIINTAYQMRGKDIKQSFNQDEILNIFKKKQDEAIRRWVRKGYGIAGGLDAEEIGSIVYSVFSELTEKLYSNSTDNWETLISINEIKDYLGDLNFRRFVSDLNSVGIKKRIPIEL